MRIIGKTRISSSKQAILVALTALGSICALLMPALASAATHSYEVLIDADGNAATGCTVSNSAGAAAGVEIIVRATVNTTQNTANATALERLNCQSGTFGAASAQPGHLTRC
ncbi:MAG: hypothetical protein IPP88_14865 [Betaproteobacteria bacterium]|nr:hypothetical protein [Betaproteobacteria bacterium]